MTKNIVVITGASGNIGSAIAKNFLENNFLVFGFGRNLKKIEDLFKDKKNFEFLNSDLSTDEGIINATDIVKKIGKVSSLINCAGINLIKSSQEISINDFNNLMNINVKSSYFLSKACIEVMRKETYGRILNIGSIWGSKTKVKRSLYSTSKSALAGMTRSLAAEYASENILVNCLSPGFIDTELTKKSLNVNELKDIKKQIPIGRLGEIDEIAKISYQLASKENSYITGQEIIVDGGFTIV